MALPEVSSIPTPITSVKSIRSIVIKSPHSAEWLRLYSILFSSLINTRKSISAVVLNAETILDTSFITGWMSSIVLHHIY